MHKAEKEEKNCLESGGKFGYIILCSRMRQQLVMLTDLAPPMQAPPTINKNDLSVTFT